MNSHYLLAKIAASVCQLCNRTADFNLHVLVWVKTTTADLLISQLVIDYLVFLAYMLSKYVFYEH